MTKHETLLQTRGLKSLMSRGERKHLWDLAEKNIPVEGLAIEIGTWKGASALILAEICKQKKARLICIDLFSKDLHGEKEWVGVDPDFMSLTLHSLKDYAIHYFTGESQKICKYLQNNIADFIFIDGDHHLPGVKSDIEGYYEKLKAGGFYCGHDYAEESDVKEIVDNFLGKTELFGTVWSKIK
jgi:predicted O-methyltransferase YrrM